MASGGCALPWALQALHLISESKETLWGSPPGVTSVWPPPASGKVLLRARSPGGGLGAPGEQLGCWIRLVGRVEPQVTPKGRTQLSGCQLRLQPPCTAPAPTHQPKEHTRQDGESPSVCGDLFQA